MGNTNRGRSFTVTYTPNTLGRERVFDQDMFKPVRLVAPGSRSAMARANAKEFGFDRVRFLTHPSARHLATVYDTDGAIIGQLTAQLARV